MIDIHTLKKFLFPVIFGIVYCLLILTVFFGNESISEIGTTIGLQIILMVFGLLAIQSRKHIRYRTTMLSILITGIVLTLISLIFQSFSHAVFLLMTHITLGVFARERYHLRISSKKIYLRRASHRGLHNVSILLAITYTAVVWIAGSGISIECKDIQDDTIGMITQYVPSFGTHTGFNTFITTIQSRSDQSIGQLLGLTEDTTITGADASLSTGSDITAQSPITVSTGDLGNDVPTSGLISSLIGYQTNFINGLIKNQELIDSQVCDLTLNHIKRLVDNSDIKLIGFILMVVLLLVFIRSIFFVISIINFIILQILFRSGRFTKTTHKEEVEEIDM